MCMIGDEYADILQQRERRARKAHRCDECNREIVVGEQYLYEFTLYEGEPFAYHTCGQCVEARVWLSVECHGWLYGAVLEDISEHWEEPPFCTVPFARLVVGVRRRWRRRDGTLMPREVVAGMVEASLTRLREQLVAT